MHTDRERNGKASEGVRACRRRRNGDHVVVACRTVMPRRKQRTVGRHQPSMEQVCVSKAHVLLAENCTSHALEQFAQGGSNAVVKMMFSVPGVVVLLKALCV